MDILHHLWRHAGWDGDAGGMRCQEHFGVRPEAAFRRQRFGFEHIQRSAGDMAGIKRGQHIFRHHVAATCAIDHISPARQGGEQLRVQNAARFRCEWQ